MDAGNLCSGARRSSGIYTRDNRAEVAKLPSKDGENRYTPHAQPVLNRVLGVRLFGSTDGFAARFSPEATLVSLLELLGRAELYEHVRVSLKRILVGLLLALLIGVLGFTLDAFARGLHQRWGHAQLA